MSATALRIVGVFTRTARVIAWGIHMDVGYEYDPGDESPVVVSHRPHGCPANVELRSCTVAGTDITEMLSEEQREAIEEKILEMEQE